MALKNKAAMEILVQSIVKTFFFEKIYRNRIAGSQGRCIFNYLRNSSLNYFLFYSPVNNMKISIASHLHKRHPKVLPVFVLSAMLVVDIYISIQYLYYTIHIYPHLYHLC